MFAFVFVALSAGFLHSANIICDVNGSKFFVYYNPGSETKAEMVKSELPGVVEYLKDLFGVKYKLSQNVNVNISADTSVAIFGESSRQLLLLGSDVVELYPKSFTDENYRTIKGLLIHELSHRIFWNCYGGVLENPIWGRIPTWFDEGIADLYLQETNPGIERLKKYVQINPILPVNTDFLKGKKIFFSLIDKKDETIGPKIYAIVGEMVYRIYKKTGKEGLFGVIDRIRKGEVPDEVLTKETGYTIDGLYKEILDDLKK